MTLTYPFTEEQSRAAYDEWGANCGPNALAFALQLPLDAVRPAIPDFESRRYTSPTMMRQALANLGRSFEVVHNPSGKGVLGPGHLRERGIQAMFTPTVSLVRIQWTGPWTAEGASGKWAARQTHWIVCWCERGSAVNGSTFHPRLFDCNGGIQTLAEWERTIVPLLTASVKRADGGWFPANVWRLTNA